MWKKLILGLKKLDRHPSVSRWVEAITWFAPPLVIPTLRAMNDEPELRKQLYIRDASTYMVGTLVFWGIKNLLERSTGMKFMAFATAMTANMLYAGYGAVKLSQWIGHKTNPALPKSKSGSPEETAQAPPSLTASLKETLSNIRHNRAFSLTNPFRPEDTRYAYHQNPTFTVPRPIPPPDETGSPMDRAGALTSETAELPASSTYSVLQAPEALSEASPARLKAIQQRLFNPEFPPQVSHVPHNPFSSRGPLPPGHVISASPPLPVPLAISYPPLAPLPVMPKFQGRSAATLHRPGTPFQNAIFRR